jgi:hypothetical protein
MGFINRKVQKAFGLPETSMKDAREAMKAAPDLMRQANEMRANAQAMAAAQQQAAAAMAPPAAAMAAMGGPVDTSGPEFEPIAGVSLELYANISKSLGAAAADPSQASAMAMSKGVTPEDWELASKGWAGRIQANRSIGQQFNQYYMAG